MDKRVCLRDYAGIKKEVIIPDFEDVVRLGVLIISGDEVLLAFYKNGNYKEFDSSNDRTINFYDGSCNLPLDKVDEFSDMDCSSCEVADYFRQLNEREDKVND